MVGHPFLVHGGGAHTAVPVASNGGWTHRDDLNIRGFCFADDVVGNLHLTCPFVCCCVCVHGLCYGAKTHMCLHYRDVAGRQDAVGYKGALRNGCYRWSPAVSLLLAWRRHLGRSPTLTLTLTLQYIALMAPLNLTTTPVSLLYPSSIPYLTAHTSSHQ